MTRRLVPAARGSAHAIRRRTGSARLTAGNRSGRTESLAGQCPGRERKFVNGKRQFVAALAAGETVDDVFRAGKKQLRPNRNGNLYLQVELSDCTGSITAMIWNAGEELYRSFESGDFLHVEGKSQVYQGNKQIIATHLSRVSAEALCESDFVVQSQEQVQRLLDRLRELIGRLRDAKLRALAEVYLADEVFLDKLRRAPAGIKNHHAYHGGLLEHVVKLMEVVLAFAPCYPEIDQDLLLMGAFLHDLAKVDELTYDDAFDYTDEGQLVGHLVMAVGMLDEKLRQLRQQRDLELPRETVLRLKHLVVSHHGEYEFGSPKLPMTLEALALHHLDNLDSKIHAFAQHLRDDPNADSAWTHYHPSINRKLFKGADFKGSSSDSKANFR